jgi:hypothetical protein
LVTVGEDLLGNQIARNMLTKGAIRIKLGFFEDLVTRGLVRNVGMFPPIVWSVAYGAAAPSGRSDTLLCLSIGVFQLAFETIKCRDNPLRSIRLKRLST